MPYSDKLMSSFTNSLVRKIAIVDDGFDLPSCSDLEPDTITEFRTIISEFIDDPEEDIDHILDKLSTIEGLPAIKDVIEGLGHDEGVIKILWKAYRALDDDNPLWKMLRRFFTPFAVEKDDKLGPLDELRALIKTTTDITADTFGSDTTGSDVVGYDLLFLDFYLNAAAPAHLGEGEVAAHNSAFIDGRARSMDFLKDVVVKSKQVPLVMLISSVAKAEDIPDFRQHACMLASKINFLPKEQLNTNPRRAQHAILGLVQYRRESDALSTLIDTWKDSVDSASNKLMSLLLELDLPDYSYLQSFRLNDEKVPLAHYLGWLFNGYLTSQIEDNLCKFAIHDFTGKIALPLPIPGRVAPTKAIATLYSGVTTSYLPKVGDGFKPNAWAGDVFIKTTSYNKIFGRKHSPRGKLREPMPEVMCVITPSCDLIPGRANNVKTVTFIGGTLVPLDGLAPPTSHLLLLNDKPFHVAWDSKWPITVNLNEIDGLTAIGKHYRWCVRVREVYHAELQHLLFKDVGRVGVPIVPSMPICVDLRVLAKQHGKPYAILLDRKAKDSCVWTFRVKNGVSAYCIREEIAWEIQLLVTELVGLDLNNNNVKLIEYSSSNDFVEKLQDPIIMTSMSKQIDKTGILIKQVVDVEKEIGDNQQSYFVMAVSLSK